MTNLYLIVLSTDYKVDDVTAYVEQNNKIEFWFRNLPYSIFVKTKLTSEKLSELLDLKFKRGRHIVVKIGKNSAQDYWGHLPKSHWEYFK